MDVSFLLCKMVVRTPICGTVLRKGDNTLRPVMTPVGMVSAAHLLHDPLLLSAPGVHLWSLSSTWYFSRPDLPCSRARISPAATGGSVDSGGEGRIGADSLRVSYSLHPRNSPENLRGGGSCPGSHSNWRSWDVNPGLSDSKAASLAACRWRVPGSSARGGGK